MSDSKLDHSDDEDDGKGGKGKSRRELPAGAVATLKAWLLSPEHFTHPYPTPQDQVMLMQKTGIDKKQLKNWFTNARRRIWKPMLKKQLEQGKLAATGAGGGGVAVPGVVPGLMIPTMTGVAPTHPGAPDCDNPHAVQSMHVHYQQTVQQPPSQPQQYDQYGNPVYVQQPVVAQPAPSTQPGYTQHYYQPQQQYGQPPQSTSVPAAMAASSSIGSLPPMAALSAPAAPTNISAPTMNKTDSHAVLMELFARDQDLVRQANESAKMKATTKTALPSGSDPNFAAAAQQIAASQHPMKMGSQTKLVNVPSLNTWPHFSSISSLNNLGTMTGVKSITSMSGADLASQGNMNRMGNLAQVKSMESMGKNDSYAFLEVFFGDRSMSSMNMAGKDQQRGVKREREEDNNVGLSLDGDESPSTAAGKTPMEMAPTRAAGAPTPAPLPVKGKDPSGETGTLKRAYDDALAARGLISVSRSCENLSDLALPAKMQKTLSQQFLLQHQAQAQAVAQQQQPQPSYGQYSYTTVPTPAPAIAPIPAPPAAQGTTAPAPSSQQYPGQHPQQQQQAASQQFAGRQVQAPPDNDGTTTSGGEVQVPFASLCSRCHTTGVDTQLRPCGHMFHERCLKPSLQVPVGQPKCPIDHQPIQSALLAVPTDEPPQPQQWSTATPVPSYKTAIPAESSTSKA
eukprot:CAMPEP_0119008876 /NCGR_PEP_ID=MMETSP1176-20130426/3997_1 /TAXON_ID=265551 /ORGANISM="Synedropsis recta cf, Strain CCMP1620" /LENGTH=679 /DNA_ID=CAMNT_0006961287 /DNA_START=347 /DNA_END=2386 /DNA_ORIENTATION=+